MLFVFQFSGGKRLTERRTRSLLKPFDAHSEWQGPRKRVVHPRAQRPGLPLISETRPVSFRAALCRLQFKALEIVIGRQGRASWRCGESVGGGGGVPARGFALTLSPLLPEF